MDLDLIDQLTFDGDFSIDEEIVNNIAIDLKLDLFEKYVQPIHTLMGDETCDALENMLWDQSGGSIDFFEIEKTKETTAKKFGIKNTNFKIKFKNLPDDFEKLQSILYSSVQKIIENAFEGAGRHYKARIVILHPTLDMPIQLPFMAVSDLSADAVIKKISQVSQSKKGLHLDESMIIHTSTVRIPSGSGTKRFNKFIANKKSIIKIKNVDNLCALRCIVVGKAYADQLQDKSLKNYYIQIRKANHTSLQTIKAYELAKEVGLPIDQSCNLADIQKIESHIMIYQIIVVSESENYGILYAGPEKDKKIYMLYHDNHFDLIKSMTAFYKKRYYCDKCQKPYNSYKYHPCNKFCKSCCSKLCKTGTLNTCTKCKAKCADIYCLKTHEENICNKQCKCEICGRIKSKIHTCNGRYCLNCKKSVPMDHYCFILTENERSEQCKKNKPKREGFIFFDYECMVDGPEHIPNLIVAEKMCNKCLSKQTCLSTCGLFSFNNNESFCEWLLTQKYFTCLAHNMKAYDGLFLMKYLCDNPLPTDKSPNIVLNGSKLMSIEIDTIKIIDSYNFIPMPLGKFPSTFGFQELRKGYFPHLFNTLENQNKIFSEYPSTEYYGDKFMSTKDREQFLKWHRQQQGKLFDLQQELYLYCLSDVDILKKGCLLYRELFMNITKLDKNDAGIDPFEKCLTLPSACHLLYRRNFMVPKSIAVIADYGFDPTQNYSHKKMLWLKYVSYKTNSRIEHCFNGKEKRIGAYSVDGYCKESDTVYEFLGCWVHGCNICFKPETYNPIKCHTMGYIYKQTIERNNFVKQYANNYVEIWEHEWDNLMKNDTELREFCRNLDVRAPLKPRDALFGGRTNAAKLYHKCEPNEKIKYFDVTSLYPFVQKTGKYPKGAPSVITENFGDFNKYFGLVHCKILPPKKLRFPVLPLRINNKLVFTLCYKCALYTEDNCCHNNEERMLEGTWVTEEVKLALENDYHIVKLYSVWHWNESEQYDPKSKSGGLFTDYVNTFLKVKQENSGYPDWCKTDSDKQKYINDYHKHEGIELDSQKIQKNEGLRAISKFLLNSMWGRYCLQTNKVKYQMVYNLQDFYKFFINDQYEVHDVFVMNENVAQIFYSDKEELHQGGRDSNVVLGAFVTCYGRMTLYKELKLIDDRILYFDTDSIIFISKTGYYEPELADYLGKFTDEIKDKDYIIEFVSAGPKNYAYLLNNGQSYCKIKGFTMSFGASQKLNFDSMKEIVLNKNKDDRIEVEQNKFIRDKSKWSIRTEVIHKLYRQVYDKRILLDDLSTLPYGY